MSPAATSAAATSAAASSTARGFGWGIVGPGKIAHRFADAVTRLPGAYLAAAQGRDLARVTAFATEWARPDPPAIHTSLDALLRDPAVDAIYVATPHAFHAEAVRAALDAGKPVLCEKSLAPTAALARELAGMAQARGVFLMEALWTRFLPVYADVGEWLASGAIGAVRGIQSSFCFAPPYDPASRLFDPAQAGGALLDLGVYNLSMTQWVLRQALGSCPPLLDLAVQGALAPSGVDSHVAATLVFDGGIAAQFQCGFDGHSDDSLRILGSRGHIVVPTRFHEATRASLHVFGDDAVHVERPWAINGFEGEIIESMRCIADARVDSPVMPLADTVAVAGWMDAIRARLGVHYPFD